MGRGLFSAPYTYKMDLEGVYNIIHAITEGLEESILQCLESQSRTLVYAVQEQIFCGQTGDGKFISPTYDDDPFFEEEGFWYHRSKDYKAWKYSITPPAGGTLLGLPPRPDNVPNLYINGKFFSEITATRRGNIIYVDPGSGNGPAIVAKYGDSLLNLGESAVAFFNREYLRPALDAFFRNSGYK